MSGWASTLVAVFTVGTASSDASVDPLVQALLRHMAQGVSDAKPGDWISYRTDAGGARISFWRFAAVGRETDSLGRDSLWIEIELGPHEDLRAPLAQIKMLVARERGLAAEGISRVFVALGADKPQEISPEQLHAVWRSPLPAGQVRREPPSGEETIRPGNEARLMTRAGTLPAIPIEIYHQGLLIQRIWMSHRLPLLRLAKVEMPSIGHAMEVTGFGVDARPRMVVPKNAEPNIRLEPQGSAGTP